MGFKFGVYIDVMIFASIFAGFMVLLDFPKDLLYWLFIIIAFLINVVLYAFFNRNSIKLNK